MTRAAVLGSGSWGTAFSIVLADAGTDVTLWARRPELSARIAETRENVDYLPGITVPENVRATGDEQEALDGADFVVLAVPSQRLRTNLERWAPLLPARCTVVSLLKGIEVGTTLRMSEVVSEVTGFDGGRIAVVTGPNLAPEIARRQPAAAVVGCIDVEVAARLQHACRTAYFRPYTNTDVVGCELGGAVKNVIALAVGMVAGMGLGDNAKASLITRGLAETARLGRALGADPMTFAGLAGLGDLTATCFSPLSRNRTFGERLGRGSRVADVAASTHQTAEGVTTCESVIELADRVGVDMPICEQVLRVVRGTADPREAVETLMSRTAKPEM